MHVRGHIRNALSHAWLLLNVALVAALATGTAQALEVPALSGRVNDHAGVLTPERAKMIEQQLAAYERRTGHQLALLTVKSLEGDAIEDFSIRVVEAWKLGDAKRDQGLLLIVVPDERKVRIEVGYGLEGDIPDAVAARVIREIIAPAFRRGEYGLGIELAFEALMQAASGRAGASSGEASESHAEQPHGRPGRSLLNLIPFLLMMIFLFGVGGGRGGRGGAMLAGAMLAGMGGGHRGGGGGGFRGGGGGFGGGGASGGW